MLLKRSLFAGLVAVLAVGASAAADEGDPVRISVNGRGWNAAPVNWSDGRVSIIVVPDAVDPAVTAPQTAPSGEDAVAAVNLYLRRSGRDCTIDGVLHPVGPVVTGSGNGWAGSLNCKPPT